MQGRLRRLTHGADEQQDANGRHRIPRTARQDLDLLPGHRLGSAEYGRVVERTGKHDHAGDAEDEAEITDAVDEESLQVGEDRRLSS